MPRKKATEPRSLESALSTLKAGAPGAALLAELLAQQIEQALQGNHSPAETLLALAALKNLLAGSTAAPPLVPRRGWPRTSGEKTKPRRPADTELDVAALRAGLTLQPGALRLDLTPRLTGPGVQAEAEALTQLLAAVTGKQALEPADEGPFVGWLQPLLPAGPPERAPSTALEPLRSLLKFPADRIHKGAVEAFSAADQWRPGDRFYRAHEASGSHKDFAMLCGFAADPGEEIWTLLLSRGEAVIKAHYALWARLYEQTGGQPGQHAVMNINQFCADLGYKPHHKGGFKRERKQEAMRLLEALTSVEIAVRFRVIGSKTGRIREISGRLWERGYAARERDQYGDLFGQAREGDPDLWDPTGFSFGPGPWFADPAWRNQNRYLGLIGAGLMKLQPDNDQAAIRIGGYLGALARFDQFRTRRIRVATLLERIGMADSYPRHPRRLQELIERGLFKLVEVGILARWDYTDVDPTEPDMDDPEALAALADTPLTPWRRQMIEVEWPAALLGEAERLEAAERRAISERKKRLQPEAPPADD
jgi:hypothetical protein